MAKKIKYDIDMNTYTRDKINGRYSTDSVTLREELTPQEVAEFLHDLELRIKMKTYTQMQIQTPNGESQKLVFKVAMSTEKKVLSNLPHSVTVVRTTDDQSFINIQELEIKRSVPVSDDADKEVVEDKITDVFSQFTDKDFKQ